MNNVVVQDGFNGLLLYKFIALEVSVADTVFSLRIIDENCWKVSWMSKEEPPQQQKMTKFTKRKINTEPEGSSGVGRHSFFRVRKLDRMTEYF